MPGIKGSRSDTRKPDGFCNGNADSAYAESACIKTVEQFNHTPLVKHCYMNNSSGKRERKRERKRKKCILFQMRFSVLH